MTEENEANVDESTTEEVEETTETTETEETLEEQTQEETAEEKIARLEKENHTLKIQKGKIKKKAERAEEAQSPKKDVDLSFEDAVVLSNTKGFDPADMAVYKEYIAKEGSVEKALKNEDLAAILERRAETRRAQLASNTGNAASGKPETSPDELRDKARTNFSSMTPEEVKALASQ